MATTLPAASKVTCVPAWALCPLPAYDSVRRVGLAFRAVVSVAITDGLCTRAVRAGATVVVTGTPPAPAKSGTAVRSLAVSEVSLPSPS